MVMTGPGEAGVEFNFDQIAAAARVIPCVAMSSGAPFNMGIPISAVSLTRIESGR